MTKANFHILEFSPELKAHFEKLNREWIEKYFEIEAHDLKMFSDPEKEIIQKGGDIVFIELDGEIVGTGALTYDGEKYELAKLAVADKAKGRGLGEILTKEILKRAKAKGARRIQLTTNSILRPALELYKKLGFKVIFSGAHPRYKRVDLIMEMDLNSFNAELD